MSSLYSAQVQLAADDTGQRFLGIVLRKPDPAAERPVHVNEAEDNVRVGNGRLGAAPAVAGRSGPRAGTARAYGHLPASHLRDAAAPGRDRGGLQHVRT